MMDLALVSEHAARRASGWNRRRGAPSEHASKAQEREQWEAREPVRGAVPVARPDSMSFRCPHSCAPSFGPGPPPRRSISAGTITVVSITAAGTITGSSSRQFARLNGLGVMGQAKGIGAVAPLTRGSEGIVGPV
jgi:hypothetical protein